MWQIRWIVLSAALAIGVIGCNRSDETGQRPTPGDSMAEASDTAGQEQTRARGGSPEAAVFEFLEAVRTGNDDDAAAMLTVTARRKTAELNMEVAPPGSDTAEFEVGKVEYLSDDGARVACNWSDLDETSQRRTDEILWMLRRESQGWRIAGVAATVFEGEPPLLLNFEDPEEMLRKQQWVEEEIHRRDRQENSQAQRPENFQESSRR
jgi:hypothetical protein